jgi:hypothetical protein
MSSRLANRTRISRRATTTIDLLDVLDQRKVASNESLRRGVNLVELNFGPQFVYYGIGGLHVSNCSV